MLVSLLMNEFGQVIGGALACDHLAYGQNFWNDVCGIEASARMESAVLEIPDKSVVEALLNLQYDESHREIVDQYFHLLETGVAPTPTPSRSRAA